MESGCIDTIQVQTVFMQLVDIERSLIVHDQLIMTRTEDQVKHMLDPSQPARI